MSKKHKQPQLYRSNTELLSSLEKYTSGKDSNESEYTTNRQSENTYTSFQEKYHEEKFKNVHSTIDLKISQLETKIETQNTTLQNIILEKHSTLLKWLIPLLLAYPAILIGAISFLNSSSSKNVEPKQSTSLDSSQSNLKKENDSGKTK